MSDTMRPDWSGRFRALRQANKHDRLDALVVSTPANLRYLTGFAGSAGLLVLTDDAGLLWSMDATPAPSARPSRQGSSRRSAWSRSSGAWTRRWPDCCTASARSASASRRRTSRSRRFDVAGLDDRRGVAADRAARRAPARHQGSFELDGCAARPALSAVARDLGQVVAAGRTEREVARDIDRALDRAGFSEPAFPTIVASGPNSAHPHARPTDRRLAEGDLVVLDFGGVLDGYCVDLTRMAAVGQVAPGRGRCSRRCTSAQAAAIAAVRAGRRRRRTWTRPPATCSRHADSARRSSTAPVTVWASTCTRRRGWLGRDPGASGRARSRHGLHDRARRVRRRARRCSAGGRCARDG